MNQYQFKGFQIITEQPNYVTTIYDDGAQCKVWPIENDKTYGDLLGITPFEHKLLHEIVHQVLAQAKGLETCPIVRAQALLQPMPKGADRMEHEIMAMTFMAMRKPMYDAGYWDAIKSLEAQGVNLYKAVADIQYNFFKMKL